MNINRRTMLAGAAPPYWPQPSCRALALPNTIINMPTICQRRTR